MFDEVQCGVARTGKLFAHEWSGITPDIMGIAKGIGGGFPVGACLTTERVALALTAGSHGSTFGGNPIAMSAANAVLDVILEDGFMAHVNKIGGYLRGKLEELVSRYPDLLEDVRGEGGNGVLNTKLFERNLLTVLAGDNVVRFVPPLIITQENVDEAILIIDQACQDLAGKD